MSINHTGNIISYASNGLDTSTKTVEYLVVAGGGGGGGGMGGGGGAGGPQNPKTPGVVVF